MASTSPIQPVQRLKYLAATLPRQPFQKHRLYGCNIASKQAKQSWPHHERRCVPSWRRIYRLQAWLNTAHRWSRSNATGNRLPKQPNLALENLQQNRNTTKHQNRSLIDTITTLSMIVMCKAHTHGQETAHN